MPKNFLVFKKKCLLCTTGEGEGAQALIFLVERRDNKILYFWLKLIYNAANCQEPECQQLCSATEPATPFEFWQISESEKSGHFYQRFTERYIDGPERLLVTKITLECSESIPTP